LHTSYVIAKSKAPGRFAQELSFFARSATPTDFYLKVSQSLATGTKNADITAEPNGLDDPDYKRPQKQKPQTELRLLHTDVKNSLVDGHTVVNESCRTTRQCANSCSLAATGQRANRRPNT
jgi:hypothetical protein